MASTNTFGMRTRGDGNVGVRVAAETRLADLRQKLREALAQKKTRIAEFVEACKADRRAIREQVQEMRARSLRDLRDQIQAARGAAKLTRLTRLAEIRQVAGAPVEPGARRCGRREAAPGGARATGTRGALTPGRDPSRTRTVARCGRAPVVALRKAGAPL